MAHNSRFAAIAGMAAALSMAATPVAAAELPTKTSRTSAVFTPGTFHAEEADADGYRRWRRHRHNRVDAGDVLAGVLFIGGIAAIASAASKSDRDRRYRDRDYRYPDRDYRNQDYRYRERRGDSRYDGGRGIDNAVEMCVSEIERDVRVDTVDEVNRTGEGWRVTGSLYNGDRFTCRIGQDGRIDDVDFGGFAASSTAPRTPVEDKQWSDDRYAAAWADVGAEAGDRGNGTEPAPSAVTDGPQPAYPGGPIDGDVDAPEAEIQKDDRYTMASAGN